MLTGRRSANARARSWLVTVLALSGSMSAGLVATAPATASAAIDQFTLFDADDLVHDHNSFAQPDIGVSVPADWTAPVNYAAGRMYLRLAVTPRPSNRAVDVQVCMWRKDFVEETCSPQTALVTGGVQWIDLGRPANWWRANGTWRFDTAFSPVRLMLKDHASGRLMMSDRCGTTCYPGGDLLAHVPIELDASAIVVAPGATLAPPSTWAGCPSSWSPDCATGIPNQGPVASAGPDLVATVGVPVAIHGSVTDDGLPASSPLRVAWVQASGPGTVSFAHQAPDTTAVFSAPGAYSLRLSGSDGALRSADTVNVVVEVPGPPLDATAVLVVGKTALTPSDRATRDRLRGLGYAVTVLDDDLSGAFGFIAYDLVVIAPTSAAARIPASLAVAGVPLLNLEAPAHARLGLGTGGADRAGVSIVDVVGAHPVASGLTGPTTIARSASLGRAVPVAGATTIATLRGRPADVQAFAVEQGTSLTAGVAAARRVGFYLGGTAPALLEPAGWTLFDAAVRWVDPPAARAVGPWQFVALPRRIPVVVDPALVPRDGGLVEVALDGASSGTFDPATIRVVEVDRAGAVVDLTVARQFDRSEGFDGTTVRSGVLLIQLEGITTGPRRFHVYYGNLGNAVAPAIAPVVHLTEGVVDEGHPSLLVETPTADWYYHTEGGGFSSLVDRSGEDWLSWNQTEGPTGSFRGVPNAVYPAGHLHPGDTGSSTRVLYQGPLRVSFETSTDDHAFRVRWDVSATTARMTVLDALTAYWFLYEGTPGGQIDLATDTVIRSDGTTARLASAKSADLVGEWSAFADTVRGRSVFVSQTTEDSVTDSYRLMQNAMTVFGFGRADLDPRLAGPLEFVVGLVDATTFAALQPTVVSETAPFVAITRAAEARP